MMDAQIHADIHRLLHESNRLLIVSHIRPDGDAIGSVLGLGLSLLETGKTVQMVLSDGVQRTFKHLTGSRKIHRHSTGEFDAIITLDASDPKRLGDGLADRVPDLNIDHHVTNLNFARINFVIPDAVATAAILAEYLPVWELPITKPVAEALLTGIVTDTIGFRTSNMNAETLRLAAGLMELGADLPDLYKRALINRSFSATRYWGKGLSELQREGRLAWTTLTLADRKNSGYSGTDDADLTNVLSGIDECDIVILFNEQKGGTVKVSWRSQPGYDVSQIAFNFGGGGHSAAAGADIPGTLDDVQNRVLEATRAVLSAEFSDEKA